MKTASLVLGIIAIVGLLIGLVPCMGWFNWLNIPLAVVGLILGILDHNENRKQDMYNAPAGYRPYNGYQTGVILCGIAVGIGILRLAIGGGVF